MVAIDGQEAAGKMETGTIQIAKARSDNRRRR